MTDTGRPDVHVNGYGAAPGGGAGSQYRLPDEDVVLFDVRQCKSFAHACQSAPT